MANEKRVPKHSGNVNATQKNIILNVAGEERVLRFRLRQRTIQAPRHNSPGPDGCPRKRSCDQSSPSAVARVREVRPSSSRVTPRVNSPDRDSHLDGIHRVQANFSRSPPPPSAVPWNVPVPRVETWKLSVAD